MIFEKATRAKLRFAVSNGVISTEDLWDLSLPKLDDLAKSLNKQIQESEVSFITDRTPENTKVQLAFDVVKHIIDVKLNERDAAKASAEIEKRRRQLREALEARRANDLNSKSEEELLKELQELEGPRT